jgi:hypothetical protein
MEKVDNYQLSIFRDCSLRDTEIENKWERLLELQDPQLWLDTPMLKRSLLRLPLPTKLPQLPQLLLLIKLPHLPLLPKKLTQLLPLPPQPLQMLKLPQPTL